MRVHVLYKGAEILANSTIPAVVVSATYSKQEKAANTGSIPVRDEPSNRAELIACVRARREKWREIDSGIALTGIYQRCRPVAAHPPTQQPTQNSYR
jgi:hypothetical protein